MKGKASLSVVAVLLAGTVTTPAQTRVSVTVSGTVTTSNFTAIPVGSKFFIPIAYDPNATGTLITSGSNFFMRYSLPSSGPLKVASSQISFQSVRLSILDEWDVSSAGTGPYEDAFDWVSGIGPLSFSGGLKKELGATSCSTCIDYVRVFFSSVLTTEPVPPLTSFLLPSPFPRLSEWLNGAYLQVGAFDSSTGQNLFAQGTVVAVR